MTSEQIPSEQNILPTIEGYLLGTLSKSEVATFELLMKKDRSIYELYKQYQALLGLMQYEGKKHAFRELLRSRNLTKQDSKQRIIALLQKKSLAVQYFAFKNKATIVAASFIGVFLSVALWIFLLLFDHRNELIELKRNVAYSIHKLEHKIDTKNTSKIDNIGTGFLIDNNGYILTNQHVLAGAENVSVENIDGESYKAEVVKQDAELDIAMLRIIDSHYHEQQGYIPYTLSNKKVSLGEGIFTLGYPKEDIVYEEGYLSSLTGYNSDSNTVQINISLNPGNSGGPIFDEKGNVIGMVKNKQKEADGVSFAIKADRILKTIRRWKYNDVEKDLKDLSLRNTHARTPSKLQQIDRYQRFVYLVKSYH